MLGGVLGGEVLPARRGHPSGQPSAPHVGRARGFLVRRVLGALGSRTAMAA
ncbi:hypothetical protein STRIP9103_07581 [Streptomyces ipomoeae 91-03]|uniref:Uncharacterized protein n=1 Tax=Streptomyces ipomoeae 91-03 TaxID=698759 RepID=L1KTE9_9ACTN|nr:hypothetical protein STRIP9103_07581 [Streptomyces ipomoeae 91-03]